MSVAAKDQVRVRGAHGVDAASVRIKLLGRFEVTCSGEMVALPLAAQRVVAFLALQSQPRSRAYVAGTLWFETTERHANGCLRSALWRLRCCGSPLVDATRSQLRLAPEVAVDVHEQVSLARRLLDPSADFDGAGRCIILGAELLPDWYDEWVLLEREWLRQLRLHALEMLARKLRDQGRYGEAVEAAVAALRGEPLRESAHRVLIETYLAEGNRAEAIRQYRAYRDLLHRKLRLRPTDDLEELIRTVQPDARVEAGDGFVTRR